MTSIASLVFLLLSLTGLMNGVSGDCLPNCDSQCNFGSVSDWWNGWLSNNNAPITQNLCQTTASCANCYTSFGQNCWIPTKYQMPYQQGASSCGASGSTAVTTTPSTTCTDAAKINCSNSCNFNAITQWRDAYKQNYNTPVTADFCKARTDCFTCYTSIGCIIPVDYQNCYQLTKSLCDALSGTTTTPPPQSSCTAAAQQHCLDTCNIGAVSDYMKNYMTSFLASVSNTFCKARYDCYTCYKGINCFIPLEYQSIYDITSLLCGNYKPGSATGLHSSGIALLIVSLLISFMFRLGN